MSKSNIDIKESKKGSLHKHLGVSKDKKIPASKLAIKKTDSPAIRKKKQFAINARKWKHEDGGYLDSMGMGSWLVGAGEGALGGAAFGPIGIAAGATLGLAKGIMGDIGQNKQKKAQEDAQRQQMEQAIGQQRLEGSRQVSNIPTFPLGGDVNLIGQNLGLGYKLYPWGGTPSWDPNERPMHNMYELGGNINEVSDLKGYSYNLMANGGSLAELPSWYRSNALSMAKGGHMPEGNATLKEAKEFEKMYPKEMAFGMQTEYEHTGNKKLAMRIAADHIKDSIKINQGGEPDYYQKLQQAGISDELNKMPQMKGGGFLKPAKAAEMLKDGKIHGKPITERQRKYFQAIAHGWKPDKKMGGGPMDMQQGGDINKLIYNKENILKADPIISGMEKTRSNQWDEFDSLVNDKYESLVGRIPYDIKDKSTFKIIDIEEGKPGIRHGAKINKQILADLSKAAAKEKVPLMDALETSMRESGIGSYSGYSKSRQAEGLNPEVVMAGWSSRYIKGMPDSYDQYLLKRNLVPKDLIYKDFNGYGVNSALDEQWYLSNLDKYKSYLNDFKQDSTLNEPFRKEMRYLKDNTGQKYNPGEGDREQKLARERKVIMANPQLYNYADSVYNANKVYGGSVLMDSYALGGGLHKLPETGRILDRTTTSGNMDNGTSNNDNVVTEYKGGGTHAENSNGGIQIGQKARVEEGEVRFDDPDGDSSYIFSNRIPYNRK